MADVARRILDGHEAPRVIEAVLGDADVAEVATRGALSVGWAHPLRAKPLGLEVEVGADLVFEVGLRSTADHQVFSGVGPGSITRAMESTRRFQRPVSNVSCLCPVAVSE